MSSLSSVDRAPTQCLKGKQAVRSVGLYSTFDIITFNQKRHHLSSSSAGGRDLSNDTQSRTNGLIELEISTKMLQNLSEKLEEKFVDALLGNF